MIYHSVAQIFDDLQATRQRLYERIEELSPAEANFKAFLDAWSVAEILEHLSKTEQMFVKLFSDALPPIGGAGASETLPVKLEPFSMDSYVDKNRNRKLKSPESLTPKGNFPLPELLAKLRSSRAELLALQPRFEAHDLSQVVGPHPAYGPINLYQGLASVGLHESRHLRQIQAIITSPGFSALCDRQVRPGDVPAGRS